MLPAARPIGKASSPFDTAARLKWMDHPKLSQSFLKIPMYTLLIDMFNSDLDGSSIVFTSDLFTSDLYLAPGNRCSPWSNPSDAGPVGTLGGPGRFLSGGLIPSLGAAGWQSLVFKIEVVKCSFKTNQFQSIPDRKIDRWLLIDFKIHYYFVVQTMLAAKCSEEKPFHCHFRLLLA